MLAAASVGLLSSSSSSLVNTPWFLSCSEGDSALSGLSLSVQLKTGYFDILLLRKLDIPFPSP